MIVREGASEQESRERPVVLPPLPFEAEMALSKDGLAEFSRSYIDEMRTAAVLADRAAEAPQPTGDSRERFEAWAKKQPRYGKRVPRLISEGAPAAGEYAHGGWQEAWEAWQAAEAQRPSIAGADGWQFVPIEPTHGMVLAGVKAFTEGTVRKTSDTYRAMLAAAPRPPAAAKVGCERDDGLLNIHAESETCEVCAPAAADERAWIAGCVLSHALTPDDVQALEKFQDDCIAWGRSHPAERVTTIPAAADEREALDTNYHPNGAIDAALHWLDVALKCPTFTWDSDQAEAARQAVADASKERARLLDAARSHPVAPAATQDDTPAFWPWFRQKHAQPTSSNDKAFSSWNMEAAYWAGVKAASSQLPAGQAVAATWAEAIEAAAKAVEHVALQWGILQGWYEEAVDAVRALTPPAVDPAPAQPIAPEPSIRVDDIVEWLKLPENKARIENSLRLAAEAIAELDRARVVSFEMLHTPMSADPYRAAAPTMAAKEGR